MSPYLRELRRSVGNELVLLPSVTVLPTDRDGRVLLVRLADTGRWGTVGGSVEVDEEPAAAAVREAREEAGVEVELTRLVAALGGPEFRITYPNGDQAAYVSIVYEARVLSGRPAPDHDETLAATWVPLDELGTVDLGDFARSTFRALGHLRT
ncbi:NUDIX domain-containing protein [Haloactinopolyspora alba]|nr:NUDIX domain-containing protein [Haloactinopolyspora alba]